LWVAHHVVVGLAEVLPALGARFTIAPDAWLATDSPTIKEFEKAAVTAVQTLVLVRDGVAPGAVVQQALGVNLLHRSDLCSSTHYQGRSNRVMLGLPPRRTS